MVYMSPGHQDRTAGTLALDKTKQSMPSGNYYVVVEASGGSAANTIAVAHSAMRNIRAIIWKRVKSQML